MGNDQMREAEELEDLAETASTLVDLAKQQRHDCDELLRKLEAAVNAFESRTTELIRDMPKQIAQRAAEIVVRDIADLAAHKVANVLQPAEAKVQTLLKEMKDEVVELPACRDGVPACKVECGIDLHYCLGLRRSGDPRYLGVLAILVLVIMAHIF
jgi:hypothetical protein